MSNIHAHARTRDEARRWRLGHIRQAESGVALGDAIEAAFAAGADWSAGECGKVHREEQDLWHDRARAKAGQIAEAVTQLRQEAKVHRSEAFRLPKGRDDYNYHAGRADALTGAADGLESENPAVVLRDVAGVIAADLGLEVDHAAFDRAAAACDEPVPPGQMDPADVAAQEAFVGEALDAGIDQIDEDDEHPYEADGHLAIDHGPPDKPRFGFASGGFVGAPVADPDSVVARLSPPRRFDDGVDKTAFAIATGDPRFDPARPVTINGFLYKPAKENDHD
jgi:hypothetical protein